jgi:hypothetical protein
VWREVRVDRVPVVVHVPGYCFLKASHNVFEHCHHRVQPGKARDDASGKRSVDTGSIWRAQVANSTTRETSGEYIPRRICAVDKKEGRHACVSSVHSVLQARH